LKIQSIAGWMWIGLRRGDWAFIGTICHRGCKRSAGMLGGLRAS